MKWGWKTPAVALTASVAVVALASVVTAGDARADILVGSVGPLTGQYAVFGMQMKTGVEKAVADINAKGGVLGQKLVMEAGDDVCDPRQAVAVANQLAGKKVAVVIGHYCSGSSIPASAVYDEAGIIQISPASTNPKFTEDGRPNVFRTCGRDDQQGIVAGDYLADRFKDKKIAILNDKSAYGKGLADETKKQLNKRGIQEAMYESYTAGEKDYSALVSKMKAANIGLIYVGGYHTESGLIIRQAKQQGLNAILMSGDATVTTEFWSITGDAGEGTLMTFSPDPRKNPKAAPIVAEFKKANVEPEGYVLYAYGALQAWAQAAEKSGSMSMEKVAAALKSNQFDTVLGTISFDKKGDVTAPGYVVYRWTKGNYDYATN
jgi:branched-chain amino acid transport system substrate-binding protein